MLTIMATRSVFGRQPRQGRRPRALRSRLSLACAHRPAFGSAWHVLVSAYLTKRCLFVSVCVCVCVCVCVRWLELNSWECRAMSAFNVRIRCCLAWMTLATATETWDEVLALTFDILIGECLSVAGLGGLPCRLAQPSPYSNSLSVSAAGRHSFHILVVLPYCCWELRGAREEGMILGCHPIKSSEV